MKNKDIILIKDLLKSEQERVDAMLSLIDKADKDIDIVRIFEQGFELVEQNANMGKRLCQEVMLISHD